MQLQTVTGKELLNAVVGETYVRQVFFYEADRANNKGYPYGCDGWGAEMRLFNPLNPAEVYALANTTNGKMTWAAPGTLVWSIPAAETALWWFKEAAISVDVVLPTNQFDPQGTRLNLLNGRIKVDFRV